MKKTIKTIFLSSISLFLITGPLTAQASSFITKPANPNTINQNRFIFEARPGEEIKDTIYIENQSSEELHFEIYAVDTSLNSQNERVLNAKDAEKNAVGAWTKVQNQEITLKAKEAHILEFTINSPTDANLQDYQGAIAVELIPKESEGPIKISTRIATLIDLKLTQTPKEIPKLEQEKPYLEKIDPQVMLIALTLFLISSIYLAKSYKSTDK